ncbi:MAG: tetratricopeptide repeat protein [Chloroflexota bacterium]
MPIQSFLDDVATNLAYWQGVAGCVGDREFGRLDHEWHNLFRAAQVGLAFPPTRPAAIELTLQLFGFVERRGYWQEWIFTLEQCLANCSNEQPAKFYLLNRLGQLYRLNRQLAAAITTHEAAAIIAQSRNDHLALSQAYFNLSEDYRLDRQLTQAETYGLSALEGFISQGEARWKAATLNTLGVIAQWQGKLALAEERLREAVAGWREANQPTELARALGNLAATLRAAGEMDAARQSYLEAAGVLAPTSSELDKVMVEISLGGLYFDLGQWSEAEAAFRRANSPYLKQSSHVYYQAMVAHGFGHVRLRQGRNEEAEAYLRASVSLWRKADDQVMLANTLGTLAETLAARQDIDEATALYDEALACLINYTEDTLARRLWGDFSAQREAILARNRASMGE